jgi:hypothetical protein
MASYIIREIEHAVGFPFTNIINETLLSILEKYLQAKN